MFYNFYFSIKYNIYINVEIYVNVKICKYIFKYVYKNNDQVKLLIIREKNIKNDVKSNLINEI